MKHEMGMPVRLVSPRKWMADTPLEGCEARRGMIDVDRDATTLTRFAHATMAIGLSLGTWASYQGAQPVQNLNGKRPN